MFKGKLKYIALGIGVFVLALGIMRYSPIAIGNSNNMGNYQESRPFYERFLRGPMGPRGHHRMMWDYEGEEDFEEGFRDYRRMWDYEGEEDREEFRQEGRKSRRPRGCMGYYYNDYEFDEGVDK